MSTLPSFDHGQTSGRPAVSATGTHCGQRRPRAHRTRDFHLDLSAQFSIHDQSILELIQYKMSLENRSIPTQAGSENHGHTASLGYLWCAQLIRPALKRATSEVVLWVDERISEFPRPVT